MHIGSVFEKNDGSTLFPGDFKPLLTSTDELLDRISKRDDITIPLDTLDSQIVPFTLLEMGGDTVLHARMLLEDSSDKTHAQLLHDHRIAEIHNLFAIFYGAPAADVTYLRESPETGTAAHLVMTIIEGAEIFANGGPHRVSKSEYSIRFLALSCSNAQP